MVIGRVSKYKLNIHKHVLFFIHLRKACYVVGAVSSRQYNGVSSVEGRTCCVIREKQVLSDTT